jgi:hypothetical protein
MASKADLVIDQGTTFQTEILLQDAAGNPLVMTGYSAMGQIRKTYYSMNCTSFTCTLSNGQVIVSLTPASTSTMWPGTYVYDVVLIDPSNNVTRVVEGSVFIKAQVTNVSNNVVEETSNTNIIETEA